PSYPERPFCVAIRSILSRIGSTIMRLRNLAIALLSAVLVGCAAKQDDSGFSSVQALARDRVGQSIRWNRNSDDSKAIADEVGRILSTELTPDAAVHVALVN